MRQLRLWLALLATSAGACAPTTDAHVDTLKRSTLTESESGATPKLDTLLTYEVSAPQERATLLIEYCERTGLTVTSKDGKSACGPFVSRFEASLMAGLVPGGSVRLADHYDSPTTPAPWEKLRAPYERSAAYVGTRRFGAHRFALVTWELDDAAAEKRRALEIPKEAAGKRQPRSVKEELSKGPVPGADELPPEPPPPSAKEPVVEQELYEIEGSAPRFVTRLPWLDALVSSNGVEIATSKGELLFLQVLDAPEGGKRKSERITAWRWGMDGREKVFERSFLGWSKQKDGARELTVTRVSAKPGGLVFTPYKIAFAPKDGAKELDLDLNDWGDPGWKDQPLPDLVELTSVEKLDDAFESLEPIE